MIISYFHKNITAWSSTHGNREGGGEVTGLPRERGGVTPAHTGDPPPLLCAPPPSEPELKVGARAAHPLIGRGGLWNSLRVEWSGTHSGKSG